MRLAVQFAMRDEARFLSHHDTLRLMERAIARAGVPVKFSEGFNPRPRMNLPLPRPVGVAGVEERLVLQTTQDVEPGAVLEALRRQMPEGVELTSCRSLTDQDGLHPVGAEYALEVPAATAGGLAARLAELAGQDAWCWTRHHGQTGQQRQIDLKALIRRVDFDGQVLRFALGPDRQLWARVEEVLGLLGLDVQLDRARLVRTAVHWG